MFVYWWLCRVFTAVLGFSLVAVSGAPLQSRCTGFHCAGFSCCSSSGSRLLGLRSYGVQAQLLCSTWNLPRPGIKPVSPALAGGLLTTGPLGSPMKLDLLHDFITPYPSLSDKWSLPWGPQTHTGRYHSYSVFCHRAESLGLCHS